MPSSVETGLSYLTARGTSRALKANSERQPPPSTLVVTIATPQLEASACQGEGDVRFHDKAGYLIAGA